MESSSNEKTVAHSFSGRAIRVSASGFLFIDDAGSSLFLMDSEKCLVNNSSQLPRNVRVMWDPENLEYLDSIRSPKQKITEPKTPYHAPESEDGSISPITGEGSSLLDQAVQPDEIRSALSKVAYKSSWPKTVKGGGWTSSEDEGDEIDQDLEGSEANGYHDLSFQEHRKAHYDEFRKLKALHSNGFTYLDEEEPSKILDLVHESNDFSNKDVTDDDTVADMRDRDVRVETQYPDL